MHLKESAPMHAGPYAELLEIEAQEKEAQVAAKQKTSLKFSQQLTLAQSLQSRAKYDRMGDRYRLIMRKLAILNGTSNVPNSFVEILELSTFSARQIPDTHHQAGLSSARKPLLR